MSPFEHSLDYKFIDATAKPIRQFDYDVNGGVHLIPLLDETNITIVVGADGYTAAYPYENLSIVATSKYQANVYPVTFQ